jgi:hypothetical protein
MREGERSRTRLAPRGSDLTLLTARQTKRKCVITSSKFVPESQRYSCSYADALLNEFGSGLSSTEADVLVESLTGTSSLPGASRVEELQNMSVNEVIYLTRSV